MGYRPKSWPEIAIKRLLDLQFQKRGGFHGYMAIAGGLGPIQQSN